MWPQRRLLRSLNYSESLSGDNAHHHYRCRSASFHSIPDSAHYRRLQGQACPLCSSLRHHCPRHDVCGRHRPQGRPLSISESSSDSASSPQYASTLSLGCTCLVVLKTASEINHLINYCHRIYSSQILYQCKMLTL